MVDLWIQILQKKKKKEKQIIKSVNNLEQERTNHQELLEFSFLFTSLIRFLIELIQMNKKDVPFSFKLRSWIADLKYPIKRKEGERERCHDLTLGELRRVVAVTRVIPFVLSYTGGFHSASTAFKLIVSLYFSGYLILTVPLPFQDIINGPNLTIENKCTLDHWLHWN